MSKILALARNNKYVSALRLFLRAFGNYKFHLLLIALMGFASSAIEGIGISAVIPAFSFVNGQSGYAADTITGVITKIFGFLHLSYTFQALLLFIAVLFVSRIIVLFAIQYTTARIVFGYEKNMRSELFSLTARSSWSHLSKQKVGYLDQLLITNTTNASQFFGFVSTLTLVGTKLLAYIVIAINISPIVALVTFIVGTSAFFLFKPFFQRNKIISGNIETLNRRLAHFVNQHIMGMKTIKSFFAETSLVTKANDYFETMRRSYIKMMVLRNVTDMMLSFIGVGLVAAIFVFLYKSPGFSFAAFAVIVYAVNQIFTQIQAAQTQLHALSMMTPYLATARAYMEDARQNTEHYAGSKDFDVSEGNVVFDNVSFSHAGRGHVLSGVSFEIKQGSMVGIIGPSGAGKTTVVDLLLRLYAPEAGAIFLDGENINQFSLGEWRKRIGYVTQDAFLLNGTIKENILFYSTASQEKIVEAARTASIHDFIMTLPHGYDTVVGDRGVLLSGGQRQRIALARALLRKPRLLILDEATSALDSESERAVQDAIEKLHGTVTVLIIAHRLSTVSAVDSIIVFNQGKIVETGTPDTLLKNKDSYFYKMYHLAH